MSPMKFRISIAILAVAPSLLSGQEPVAVTLKQGICKSIDNTHKCAQAIESKQLPKSGGRAGRGGKVLQVQLASGRWLAIPDDTTGDSPSWFAYLGYMESIDHYVLWEQYVEGNSIRLINRRNGKGYSVDDMPIVSPNRDRFLTASLDLESGFNPNRLMVWRVKVDTIAPEATFEATGWGADSVIWLTRTSFAFSRMAQSDDGSLRVLSRDTVRLEHGRWKFSR